MGQGASPDGDSMGWGRGLQASSCRGADVPGAGHAATSLCSVDAVVDAADTRQVVAVCQ